MCLGKNTEHDAYVLNDTEMKNSGEEKILGITIDDKLKFESQVKTHVRRLRKRYGLCHV